MVRHGLYQRQLLGRKAAIPGPEGGGMKAMMRTKDSHNGRVVRHNRKLPEPCDPSPSAPHIQNSIKAILLSRVLAIRCLATDTEKHNRTAAELLLLLEEQYPDIFRDYSLGDEVA